MSPSANLRKRARVVLHMVMELVVVVVLAQLWLFTVTLDVMESRTASPNAAIAALACSLTGCAAVWILIRVLVKSERSRARF